MQGERIRKVLRLWELGRSQNEISEELGVSRGAVQDYTRRAKAVGLGTKEAEALTDEELLLRLGKTGGHRRRIAVEIDYSWITQELRRKGVTRELLFRELIGQEKLTVGYATFCRRLTEYQQTTGVVLKQSYVAGEYCFVDYAGLAVPIWNTSKTEIIFNAQIFVSALGYSGLI